MASQKKQARLLLGHASLEQAPGGYAGPFGLVLEPWSPAYDQLNLGQATVMSTGDVYTKPANFTTSSVLLWFNIHVEGTDVNFSTNLTYNAP